MARASSARARKPRAETRAERHWLAPGRLATESLGLFFVALALYALLALISYSAADPVFRLGRVENLGGVVGASLSGLLVGGFGFGDSSKFSWQVMPGVQWRFSDHWVAAFNWRAMGFSRADVDNVVFYGALLGIGYRF